MAFIIVKLVLILLITKLFFELTSARIYGTKVGKLKKVTPLPDLSSSNSTTINLKANPKQTYKNNGEYPFMVEILFDERHLCGGAIIQLEVVITAAHCVNDIKKERFKIKAGSLIAGAILDNNFTQIRNAYKMVRHPNYIKDKGDFDIGLIFLNKPFTFSIFVSPINMPTQELKSNGTGKILGWGKMRNTKFSKQLMAAKINYYTQEVCNELHPEVILEDNYRFCSISKKRLVGPCIGDSGGPLFSHNQTSPGNHTLIGIIESTFYNKTGHCFPDKLSYYTNVFALMDWIQETLLDEMNNVKNIASNVTKTE